MSLRQRVDRVRIEEFLRQLGARLRRLARLYLVGGTTVVFEALRPQTLDIDVVLEVSPETHGELIQAIRTLKEESAPAQPRQTGGAMPHAALHTPHAVLLYLPTRNRRLV